MPSAVRAWPRRRDAGPQARLATRARLLHSPNLGSLPAQSAPLSVYKALYGDARDWVCAHSSKLLSGHDDMPVA